METQSQDTARNVPPVGVPHAEGRAPQVSSKTEAAPLTPAALAWTQIAKVPTIERSIPDIREPTLAARRAAWQGLGWMLLGLAATTALIILSLYK